MLGHVPAERGGEADRLRVLPQPPDERGQPVRGVVVPRPAGEGQPARAGEGAGQPQFPGRDLDRAREARVQVDVREVFPAVCAQRFAGEADDRRAVQFRPGGDVEVVLPARDAPGEDPAVARDARRLRRLGRAEEHRGAHVDADVGVVQLEVRVADPAVGVRRGGDVLRAGRRPRPRVRVVRRHRGERGPQLADVREVLLARAARVGADRVLDEWIEEDRRDEPGGALGVALARADVGGLERPRRCLARADGAAEGGHRLRARQQRDVEPVGDALAQRRHHRLRPVAARPAPQDLAAPGGGLRLRERVDDRGAADAVEQAGGTGVLGRGAGRLLHEDGRRRRVPVAHDDLADTDENGGTRVHDPRQPTSRRAWSAR